MRIEELLSGSGIYITTLALLKQPKLFVRKAEYTRFHSCSFSTCGVPVHKYADVATQLYRHALSPICDIEIGSKEGGCHLNNKKQICISD